MTPFRTRQPGAPFDMDGSQPEEDDRVPWVLREDMAQSRPARRGQFAFGLGVFLLSLVLLGQYMWFHSVDVVGYFSGARPWMETFCKMTGCKTVRQRDPTRVRMTDREVRIHPRHEGALLVSARLVNTLPYAQPFPRLQFVLFNVNGEVIAARTFEPGEYLGEDMDTTMGMASYKPIQVILSVLAQEEAAVSFEFIFL